MPGTPLATAATQAPPKIEPDGQTDTQDTPKARQKGQRCVSLWLSFFRFGVFVCSRAVGGFLFLCAVGGLWALVSLCVCFPAGRFRTVFVHGRPGEEDPRPEIPENSSGPMPHPSLRSTRGAQTGEQTSERASKAGARQARERARKEASRQASKQAGKPRTSQQASRKAGKHTCGPSKANRKPGQAKQHDDSELQEDDQGEGWPSGPMLLLRVCLCGPRSFPNVVDAALFPGFVGEFVRQVLGISGAQNRAENKWSREFSGDRFPFVLVVGRSVAFLELKCGLLELKRGFLSLRCLHQF